MLGNKIAWAKDYLDVGNRVSRHIPDRRRSASLDCSGNGSRSRDAFGAVSSLLLIKSIKLHSS